MAASSSEVELEESISLLNTDINKLNEQVLEKDSKIKELEDKVEQAKPWFEMKDEERKAEEARLAEEKAAKEAEEKARIEEEARLAEETKKAEEEAKKKAEAEKYNTGLTFEDLARNPSENMLKLVKFKGKILQVINGDKQVQYRMAIDSNYDKVVLIEIDKTKLKDGNILEDDIITIEGTFVMESEYTTVRGDTRTIPAILVDNLYR